MRSLPISRPLKVVRSVAPSGDLIVRVGQATVDDYLESPQASPLQPPEMKHLAQLGKFLLREGSSLFDQVILLQAH